MSANETGATRNVRVPPYHEEAERGVLGSALLNAGQVLDACFTKGLSPDAFYVHAHAMLYEVLASMHRENRPVDILTVGERLVALKMTEEVGGLDYLEELIDATPTAAHAEYYIDLVYQKYVLRRIITRSQEAIDSCYKQEDDSTLILNRVEESIFEITSQQNTSSIVWSDLIKDAMEEIEIVFQTKKGVGTGMSTGFTDLDDKLVGMKPGEMIILAARPSMGKTSLALNIAENVATVHHADPHARGVAVFSLEMSGMQLVRRMLCSHARVPSHKLQKGYIGDVNHGDLTQAASALMKAPIYMDDTAGLEVLELRSRARRFKRKYDIQFIVIDYLQLMNYSLYAREGRQRETAAISSAVKGMAKELEVPVLVLSQLSRAPETRDRHAVPKLSDLRDSGAIEQDADVVMLLRRPSRIKGDEFEHDRTLAIVDVAKNRNGPVGAVELNFFEDYTRFDNRQSGVDRPASDAPEPAEAEDEHFDEGQGDFL
jgi:replicative DNA helicase